MKIAIRLLVAVSLLVTCVQSKARIGETLDEVLKRYGRCLKTGTTDGEMFKTFRKNGFGIYVHFYQNKVDEMGYFKDSPMSDEEMKALMQDNAPGEWTGFGWPVYSWANSGISAHYFPERNQLVIVTHDVFEREKKKEKNDLNGL